MNNALILDHGFGDAYIAYWQVDIFMISLYTSFS